jgi:hypothetical protein
LAGGLGGTVEETAAAFLDFFDFLGFLDLTVFAALTLGAFLAASAAFALVVLGALGLTRARLVILAGV